MYREFWNKRRYTQHCSLLSTYSGYVDFYTTTKMAQIVKNKIELHVPSLSVYFHQSSVQGPLAVPPDKNHYTDHYTSLHPCRFSLSSCCSIQYHSNSIVGMLIFICIINTLVIYMYPAFHCVQKNMVVGGPGSKKLHCIMMMVCCLYTKTKMAQKIMSKIHLSYLSVYLFPSAVQAPLPVHPE